MWWLVYPFDLSFAGIIVISTGTAPTTVQAKPLSSVTCIG